MTQGNTPVRTFRLDSEHWNLLQRTANARNASVSDIVRDLIEHLADRNGDAYTWRRELVEALHYVIPETGEYATAAHIAQRFNEERNLSIQGWDMIRRVREIHTQGTGNLCIEDGFDWPCETANAVGVYTTQDDQ